MKTEPESAGTPVEPAECPAIDEEPKVIEEIIVEELSIDGICGVY
jgi:mycofactocin precursor